MSDTPRTDAATMQMDIEEKGMTVPTSFARKLERELNEAIKEIHKNEYERRIVPLAAISTAAMCNTEESMAKQLITDDNPYWTCAYEDVIKAVKREMALRKELIETIRERDEWKAKAMQTRIDALEEAAKIAELYEGDHELGESLSCSKAIRSAMVKA